MIGSPVRARAAQSQLLSPLGEMARRQDHRVVGVARGCRDCRIGEAAEPGRDAGHDAERHAGPHQGQRLLAAAAEHEGVAALEAQHALALAREFDQPFGDVALAWRRHAAPLARELARRVRIGEAHHLVADQRVVDDAVGLAQSVQRVQRQ